MLDRISVHGARQHNLKNVDVEIPRNSLTVVTGLSGSGKSSLAFDTIYAEGQRRYVETLSPYARQFLDQMERPEVDSIDGLSPAISIEQKTTNRSPRSTVGTITEIYDYLRLLYSSIGIPHCPNCGHEISRQSTEQIVQQVMSLAPQEKVTIYAPIVRGRKGEYKKDLEKLARQGFVTARIDGETHSLDDDIPLDRRKNHTIEVVVDRLVVKPGIERRLEASVDTATKLANGIVLLSISGGEERMYSQKSACPECGLSIPELEPRSFSFNSKFGACEKCNGLGAKWSFDPAKVLVDLSKPLLGGALLRALQNHSVEYLVEDYARAKRIKIATPWNKLTGDERTLMLDGERGRGGLVNALMQQYERAYADDREAMEDHMSMIACKACEGRRLRPSSLAVRVKGMSIADFTGLSVMRALLTLKSWQLQPRELEIAGRIVEEIRARLEFLSEVGLDYLSLDRSAATISGGEGQRIRLATQIGSRLRGVLYVLDEPSIGLHPRDNERLLSTLERLRDLGNTVLVVEHDQETIERADYVIDLGPGAGRLGGKLVAAGPPDDVARNPLSLTGEYLSGVKKIAIPAKRRVPDGRWVEIKKAAEHNLKEIDVQFPLGLLTVVTGVSGSGKSTLVNDILHRAIFRAINGSGAYPGAHGSVRGLEHVDKVIRIDQDPIGRTPRSNPATYTGVFSLIRDIFALLPESRERGYKPGRFSFNVKGGRCEACEGDGLKRIEMNFLPDVYVTCDVCRGRRYNSETLQVKYRDHSIADVLDATVEQALEVLGGIPQIKVKLQTLMDVGLDYIHLGQSSTTLSGGEAQRIKLAKELSRRQTGKTLYVLDEPTTGLHFDDVRKLLDVLQRLVELGNTVVVIEHNLDVIKTADWILDLGPDGGEYGGRIVAAGPPEAIVRVKESYTGQALAKAGASADRRQVSLRNGTRA